ncbi:sensor histidine kinase [Actinomadura rayongensis]|uniref:sensor histidine kinase n=1 Tax=Actinomadura rayongensis TaxID=1429076 RepID=UPI001928ADA5|nr:HAMP domain-containing sensor histidine kinase [Actinomadura rayongensis]
MRFATRAKTALLRHWTMRARLTALYAGTFLLAGGLLLGVTYVLVQQRLDRQSGVSERERAALLKNPMFQRAAATRLTMPDGRAVTLSEVAASLEAQQERYRRETMTSLLTQGGVALAGTGLIGTVFGWLLAGRGLRPVHRITETARRIAAGADRGLHERIGLNGPPDEIKKLADTFDLMLERLDRSFDGQRRFIAGASHEMRTPLAVNRALIEVAVTRPGVSADARELGATLLEINTRHERLIDGLLVLADARNEPAELSPVDLAELAGSVLADATDDAGRRDVEVQPGDLRAAPVTGDPYLLERLVQNLAENAVRHNRPGGTITARTATDGDRAVLEISNTGPVVHGHQTETLFQPFRRLGDRRTGGDRGFGLGLSIVRAIAGSHGGTATATPRAGGGLTVTVTLPARRPG